MPLNLTLNTTTTKPDPDQAAWIARANAQNRRTAQLLALFTLLTPDEQARLIARLWQGIDA